MACYWPPDPYGPGVDRAQSAGDPTPGPSPPAPSWPPWFRPSPSRPSAGYQNHCCCSAHLSLRHRQISPASRGSDGGDITGQQRLGASGENPLLQQVFVHSTGSAACVLARPEDAMVLGLERGIARLMDAWCAVRASVPFTHCLHLCVDDRVLRGPTARVLLSLPPGLGASTGHAQLPAQPGHREMVCQRCDQAKPLGGSCSFAK